MGMLGEIIVFAMLKDKDTVVLQQVLLENQIGNLRQFFQGIWRVCKDKVKLLSARLDEAEDISADRNGGIANREFFQTFLYEAVVVPV